MNTKWQHLTISHYFLSNSYFLGTIHYYWCSLLSFQEKQSSILFELLCPKHHLRLVCQIVYISKIVFVTALDELSSLSDAPCYLITDFGLYKIFLGRKFWTNSETWNIPHKSLCSFYFQITTHLTIFLKNFNKCCKTISHIQRRIFENDNNFFSHLHS